MITIALSPSGDLRLGLPSGRGLDITASEAGLRCLLDVLRNAAVYKPGSERPGHIREFPTQHAVAIWMEQDRKRQVQAEKDAAQAEAAALGIDLDKLEFTL